VSISVPSYMLWTPAQVFQWLDLWLNHAKTGTFSCWQVHLSVNGSMLTDHQLRCRVASSLRKFTSRTCCVATTSLFRKQGARRHNKTGIVGRGNGILKDFIKRLVLDIQSQVAGSATIVFTVPELVSQATKFKNMLVGNKMLSAFE
jgi:hypothetical protein